MTKQSSIKQLLLSNQNWWNFYSQHKNRIRNDIVVQITKLLSCKNTIRGYQEFACTNPTCKHILRIPFTCKCKACSSCGKKAAEIWIEKNNEMLPDTSWQHITFTMPSELWDFFWYNRKLLNKIGGLAAHCIKKIAGQKKLIPGIFIAIHTFGRDLKRNVHIHLSTTTGGLSYDHKTWKSLFFHQETLMKMWRYQIIKFFRSIQGKLTIPPNIQQQLNRLFTLNHFFNNLYKKSWIVHCSKPSRNHKLTVSYLGRYIKRPPIAESKLRHYDGSSVMFRYLDHKTKSYRSFILSVDDFISRFIQHIPDIGFRMIRYYGFLANRVRSSLLPIVYQLLGQKSYNKSKTPSYAELIQKNFGIDPLICPLCKAKLALSSITFGKYNTTQLLQFHADLALSKIC